MSVFQRATHNSVLSKFFSNTGNESREKVNKKYDHCAKWAGRHSDKQAKTCTFTVCLVEATGTRGKQI